MAIAAVAFGQPDPAIIDSTAAALETAVALTARPRINRVIILTAEIENGAQGVNYLDRYCSVCWVGDCDGEAHLAMQPRPVDSGSATWAISEGD